MTNVILSIKPRYANAILGGTKDVEFRKSSFKRKDIDKVYIYSSSPEKKIVGYFYIDTIVSGHPKVLWNSFGHKGAINEKDFFNYYKDKEKGYCIKIKKVKRIEKPIDPLCVLDRFVAPQSYSYAHDFL